MASKQFVPTSNVLFSSVGGCSLIGSSTSVGLLASGRVHSLFKQSVPQQKLPSQTPESDSLLLEGSRRLRWLLGFWQFVGLDQRVHLRSDQMHDGVRAEGLVDEWGVISELFSRMEEAEVFLLNVCI